MPVEFDYKPVLNGNLLNLRSLEESDFDGLYAVASDPQMWALHPQKDRYKKEVFESFFNDAIASDSALVAREAEGKTIIGTSRYHGYDAKKSEIEIGWSFLARAYWGGIYNGEMKKLMLDHAYRFVDHVIFVIGIENIRSQKAAEKIGAGLVTSSLIRGGKENVVYRLSRPEWQSRAGEAEFQAASVC